MEFIATEPDVQDVLHHSTCTSPYNYVGSVMKQILYCIWEYYVWSAIERGKYKLHFCALYCFTGLYTTWN